GLAGVLGGLVLRAIGLGHLLNTRAVIRTGLFLSLAGVATAWSDGSRPAMLAVAAQFLFLPLVLVGAGRSWKLATGSTMVAAGAWASISHGAAEGSVGWAVDYLHLVVGAAWAGSLGLVLVLGWQARRSRVDWLPAVRRYARPAMCFVLVLGTTGTVAALSLIPGWEQLWSTSYGQILVLKITVFGAALVAALAARRWGLGGSRAALARRAMSAEGLLVVSAIVLAGLLASGAPPPATATAEQLLGPVPLSSQVTRDAGLAGQLNVEVSSDGERLDIQIFGPSGTLPGTDIQAVLTDPAGRSLDLKPRPCGSGCFTQAVNLKPGSSRVTVAARAPEWTGGEFPATLHWPPGEHSPDRLQDLVTKMRSVPELTVIETVDSGPGSVVEPKEITVTGNRFIDAEPYAGANLDEVWVLPGSPERLRLYLPGSQISAFLELDSQGRIGQARLITPGHEITRQFSYNQR
ncbi:MAG: CopD family protein, partial [Actinobacteria bacterium]|nr:CopD family protein [Actinomycetota bacterium]